MDLMSDITKTIDGASFYASNRTYLQFLNDSLRDLGVSDEMELPAFDTDDQKNGVLLTLRKRKEILKLEPLVFTIDAHKSILEQCVAGEIDLSPSQQAYHRDFIATNESRVAPYRLATLTPVDLINKKIETLTRVKYLLTPSPWDVRMDRPNLTPLIEGNLSFLQMEKERIESEVISTSQDISGFDRDFFEDFLRRTRNIPSWAKPSFRAQWAQNIPSLSKEVEIIGVAKTVPNVETTIPDKSTSNSTEDLNDFPTRPDPQRINPHSSLSLQVFGEDSDDEMLVLSRPGEKRSFETV